MTRCDLCPTEIKPTKTNRKLCPQCEQNQRELEEFLK
jgi:Zn finger protein HypA/HybF involved in hydrogenase expression